MILGEADRGAVRRRRWRPIAAGILLLAVAYGAVPRFLVWSQGGGEGIAAATTLADAFAETQTVLRRLAVLGGLPFHAGAARRASQEARSALHDAAVRLDLDLAMDRQARSRALRLTARLAADGSDLWPSDAEALARRAVAETVVPGEEVSPFLLHDAARAAHAEGWSARARLLRERLAETDPSTWSAFEAGEAAQALRALGRSDLALVGERRAVEATAPDDGMGEHVGDLLCGALAAAGEHEAAAQASPGAGCLPARVWHLVQAGRADEALALVRSRPDLLAAPDRPSWTWARFATYAALDRFDDLLAELDAEGPGRSHALGDAYADVYQGHNGIFFPPTPLEPVRFVRERVERRIAGGGGGGGGPAEALPRLRRLLERALFVEARVLLLSGRPDEALATYDRLVALAPDYEQGVLARVGAIELLRGPAAALAELERSSGAEGVACDRFQLLVRAGRLEDARALWERGVCDSALSGDALLSKDATEEELRILRARLAIGRGDDAALAAVAEESRQAAQEGTDPVATLVALRRGELAGRGAAFDYIHLDNPGARTRAPVYLLEGLGDRQAPLSGIVIPRWIGRLSAPTPSGGILGGYLLAALGGPPAAPDARQRIATFGRAYRRSAQLFPR